MNLTKNISLALGVLVAGVSFAQTTSTEVATTPVGVIGQQYTEASFGLTDIKHFSKHQYGVGVAGNVPVTPFLDLGASYDYSWINDLGHANALAATATAYTLLNGVKPFVAVGVGHEWISASGFRDNDWYWGASAGVEIPVGSVSITPRVIYSDDWRSSTSDSGQWSYEVEGNYWVSRTFAVFASVGRTDPQGSDKTWDYAIGARFKF